MDLTFQPAVPADIDTLYAMAEALVLRYENPGVVELDRVLGWMKRKITQNIESYTCILLGGQKVGFYRFCENGDRMELDDLYILPEFRGRGIGTRVVQRCCAGTCRPVMLYVFTRNTGACALYWRLGFRVTETVSATRCVMVREPEEKT